MIRVFGASDTLFNTNGDYVLKPYKAIVHEEDNGDFYLTLECGLEYIDAFVEGNIVVIDNYQGAMTQAFRINNVTKTKHKVTAKCWHVFYDAKNIITWEAGTTYNSISTALAGVNSHTITAQSPFTVSTTGSYSSGSYKSTRKTLHDAFMEIASIWGAHVVRTNWSVVMAKTIGQDRGMNIEYGKNIKEITSEEDWSAVVTKLLPVGKDGILLNAVHPADSIFITTPDVQYPIDYAKEINFTQDDIIESDYATETEYLQALVADLYDQGRNYVWDNEYPKVNYTLKAYIDREIRMGDTIKVIDKRIGADLLTEVIGYEWDCITRRFTEITFGNFMPSFGAFQKGLAVRLEQTAVNQSNGVIGGRKLVFASGGAVTWESV